MLDSFPIALLAGLVFGFLAGLGVGGGSLLMLWLTAVLVTPQGEARAINLLFFLPTAIISSCFRAKQGQLRLRPILWGIGCGVLSAAAFTLLGKHLSPGLLQKLFALLLLFTGLRELFYRPRKAK